MNKFEILKRCDLFRNLDDEQLRIVEKLCTSEVFEPGAIICKQGTHADKLYLIEHGTVGIILEVGQLSQRQVQAATDCEVVGWSALIEPYILTATVKAIEKTTVLAFDAHELGHLLRDRPDMEHKIGHGLVYVVARRLNEAYKQLLGITAQD